MRASPRRWAAFAAGLTIAALDVELCDCFLEYGSVTAEMLLLFTFVLFGSSLIWTGLTVLTAAAIAFTVLTLVIRLPLCLMSLAGSDLDQRSRMLIAWLGPRGLSSLLLVLVPIFHHVPGSEQLFPICSLVVLVSIVVHGAPTMFQGPPQEPRPAAEAPPPGEAHTPSVEGPAGDRITRDEVLTLQEAGAP